MAKQVAAKPAEVPFDYQQWVGEQYEAVNAAIIGFSRRGIFEEAVYVLPGTPGKAGSLVVSNDPVAGAVNVLTFRAYQAGTRVSCVPRSDLRSCIYEACRREPILPRPLV